MTERRLRDLCLAWQARLGLAHWQIEVRVEPVDDRDGQPTFATCERPSNYNRAVITFQPWFLADERAPGGLSQLTIDDRFRERTVVHELLHCWTRDYRALIEDHLDGMLHRDLYVFLDEVTHAVEERSMDALATALVDAFNEPSRMANL